MNLSSSDLSPILTYSQQFHRNIEPSDGNIVASPLGSWLLLTALAVSLNYEENPELEQLMETKLCCSLDEAFTLYDEITRHPDVHYTAKVWGSGENMKFFPAVTDWWEANRVLPADTSLQLPSQKELDDWASENTDGLIKKFPLESDENMVLLAANAVYSKLSWVYPFAVTEDTDMRETWAVQSFLTSREHSVLFRKYADVVYATVYIPARKGEQVQLFLPLEDVEDDVLTDAMFELLNPTRGAVLSYTDVPAVPGLVEHHKIAATYGPVFDLIVPAWSAETKHDLTVDDSFGFISLMNAFEKGKAEGEHLVAQATQSAVAEFTAEGFEAAAVTAFGLTRASAVFTPHTEQDLVVLKFSKAFGFVCRVDNIPVFSGIVKEASPGTR